MVQSPETPDALEKRLREFICSLESKDRQTTLHGLLGFVIGGIHTGSTAYDIAQQFLEFEKSDRAALLPEMKL